MGAVTFRDYMEQIHLLDLGEVPDERLRLQIVKDEDEEMLFGVDESENTIYLLGIK